MSIYIDFMPEHVYIESSSDDSLVLSYKECEILLKKLMDMDAHRQDAIRDEINKLINLQNPKCSKQTEQDIHPGELSTPEYQPLNYGYMCKCELGTSMKVGDVAYVNKNGQIISRGKIPVGYVISTEDNFANILFRKMI